MRSGLQKPGAIPFLALLVFTLLTLVPTFSSGWDINNLKAGYIGYRPNEARHFHRIKDDTSRSSARVNGGHCQRWMMGGSYQSCSDRISRPRRPAIDTPRSSFEMGPIFDNIPSTSAFKHSSNLTWGVRAFKTFVIQRLDDYQLFQSFSTRTPSVKTAPSRLTSTIANSSATPVSSKAMEEKEKEKLDETYGLLTLFRDTWQQVCHTGTDLFGRIDISSEDRFGYLKSLFSRYLGSITARDSQRYESVQPKELLSNDNHTHSDLQPTATPAFPLTTQTPNPASTAEQSKIAGVGRNSEQMRSSCMAIVIGLVVGIMWF